MCVIIEHMTDIDVVLSGESRWTVVKADVIDGMRKLPDACVDYAGFDPPYGFGNKEPTRAEIAAFIGGADLDTGGDFMSKDWSIPPVAFWTELYRVMKPGAYVAFNGGPRTDDFLSLGARCAGFERSEVIEVLGTSRLVWVQGQGMKKGLDVSKAIDDAAGVEREVVGKRVYAGGNVHNSKKLRPPIGTFERSQDERLESSPATQEAIRFDDHGSDLAPKQEPILVFRKPLDSVTSTQIHAATGWDYWHSVTDLDVPDGSGGRKLRPIDTARRRAIAERFGIEISETAEAQIRKRRGLRPGCSNVTEIREKHNGAWRVIAAVDREPYKEWKTNALAAHVLVHGTGAINCGAGRVYTDWSDRPESWRRSGHSAKPEAEKIAAPAGNGINCHKNGRFPPNVVLMHQPECAHDGARKVQASGPAATTSSASTVDVYANFSTRSAIAHRDADGTETIAAYRCLAVCPCGTESLSQASGAPPACHCGEAMRWACAVARMDEQSGERKSCAVTWKFVAGMGYGGSGGGHFIKPRKAETGGATRFFPQFEPEGDPFFYVPKASASERNAGLVARNPHVAVKPINLIARLLNMFLPPIESPLMLTPYCGSGSDGCAAMAFHPSVRWIGFEREVEFVDVAQRRIAHWEKQGPGAAKANPLKKKSACVPVMREPKQERKTEPDRQISLFG